MNLIILHPKELDQERRVSLSCHRAKHIRKVLKPQIGQALKIGLLDGPLGEGIVEQCDRDAVILHCRFDEKIAPRPRIDLLLAMPRPKVLKRLFAQIAAMGVDHLYLTNAEKVERCYFDSHVLDSDFYVPRLIEGLQQAKDTHLPRVTIHRQLKPFIEDELKKVGAETVKLLAEPTNGRRISEVLSETTAERIMLAIGPEGGWTPYEINLLQTHDFQPITMGSRVLRSDTACIALLGILNEANGC